MNNKLAFIYGKDDINRGIYEGMLEEYGPFDSENEYMHIEYLLDYVHEKYPDKAIFKGFNIHHKPETLAFVLTELYGHITFFNTSQLNQDKPVTHSGMFILPRKITPKMEETLKEFSKKLENYNIYFIYNLRLEDGILLNDVVDERGCISVEEQTDKAISVIKEKAKIKR